MKSISLRASKSKGVPIKPHSTAIFPPASIPQALPSILSGCAGSE